MELQPRPRRRSSSRGGGALLVFGVLLMLVTTAFAQETVPSPAAESATVSSGSGLAKEVFEQHVRPVLERYAEDSRGGENARGVKSGLRVAIDASRATIAERLTDRIAERRAVLDELHATLLQELQGLASTPALSTRLTALAVEAKAENDKFHLDHLFGTLICWCPDENWTKTLTGCPDACANEQKDLVKQWLAEGLTDDEIFDRMVAHPKGGERVRGYDRNWFSFAIPFLLLGIGTAFVLVALLAFRGSRATGSPVEDSSEEEDARWDDLIEQELKEMDN